MLMSDGCTGPSLLELNFIPAILFAVFLFSPFGALIGVLLHTLFLYACPWYLRTRVCNVYRLFSLFGASVGALTALYAAFLAAAATQDARMQARRPQFTSRLSAPSIALRDGIAVVGEDPFFDKATRERLDVSNVFDRFQMTPAADGGRK
jgi:hypothetical protein